MATPAGVRPASLHVQEDLAVRVRDQVAVPAVLALVSVQAMADQAAAVALDNAVDHMVPAMAPMRHRMVRHAAPRR
jgi:hypothetical protein